MSLATAVNKSPSGFGPCANTPSTSSTLAPVANVWRILAGGLPGSIRMAHFSPAAAQYAEIAELALPDDAVSTPFNPDSSASAATIAPARSLNAPLGFNPSYLKYTCFSPSDGPIRRDGKSGVSPSPNDGIGVVTGKTAR